ncbi:hypothetical protein [Facilibium subflavum]|uniref:hypothetical protein n=1 Tax=Facilibium subflavum TaxID=2219058 RepID=UPI000E64E218|nr:hypothetical protein [Facilibium subflavum]
MIADWLMNSIAIAAAILALWTLFYSKWFKSNLWRATITPLASIIGSGFLVSTPLLLLITGKWALGMMVCIILVAYGLGGSLRFNIQHAEPLVKSTKSAWVPRIEKLSRPVLGLAYAISIAFYLKLLSAFIMHSISVTNVLYENGLTSLILVFIGIVGKLKGLSMLEDLEIYSVNTKLAIIFATIIACFLYNGELLIQGQWIIRATPHDSLWMAFRKVLGMLIIVQGFETSRYLSDAYSRKVRVKTMRYAQLISGVIYIAFTALAMVIFNNIEHIDETTIIDVCKVVASALAVLLVIAAIMSQFSAAIADTVGSAGLLVEATKQKLSLNNSYIVVVVIALSLVWLTDINEVITIASKAFAVYYALQIMITLVTLNSVNSTRTIKGIRIIFYTGLLFLMLLVIILGVTVE